MSEIKQSLLKKYIYRIKTLESNITALNKKDFTLTGYIINLDDYYHLKKIINYEKNKKLDIPNNFIIKDDEKLITIKELEFKTSQYLMNMLLNGNKYIIVDSSFHKVICEKGNLYISAVDYAITKNTKYLNLILKD